MKTYTDFVEALSRKDALKMAAAKAAFFKKGGKVEKQPPSVAMGYTKKRGMKLGKSSHASGTLDLYRGIDDQDAAKELEKYKKDKGYTATKDKLGSKPNPFYGRGRADKKSRYKGNYKYRGQIPKEEIEEDQTAANLANLIGDEAKKMIQAVHKGKWRIVKQAYSNIGKLIK